MNYFSENDIRDIVSRVIAQSGICAGGAIAMIPIIIIFIAFQKYFINGMAGAVKS